MQSKTRGRREGERTCEDWHCKHPTECPACVQRNAASQSYESQKVGRSFDPQVPLANVESIAAPSFARQPRPPPSHVHASFTPVRRVKASICYRLTRHQTTRMVDVFCWLHPAFHAPERRLVRLPGFHGVSTTPDTDRCSLIIDTPSFAAPRLVVYMCTHATHCSVARLGNASSAARPFLH